METNWAAPKVHKPCTTARGLLAVVGVDNVIYKRIAVGSIAVAHDFGVAREERLEGEKAQHQTKYENVLAVLQGPLSSHLG